MWLSLKIKSESPPPEPSSFGIIDIDNNDPVGVWIDKVRVENFMLILLRDGIFYSKQIE